MLVTAVMGSYRKGNTYKIVRQIEDRLKARGDVEFQYIFLPEADFDNCKGCFTCISRGEGRCPLKDGLKDIERQLLESDGAIFASPNYACGVTAIMKRLIERMAYIGHRPLFFGKYAVTVATSGGPVGLKQTLDDLGYFAGGGFTIVSRLGLQAPPFALSEKAVERNGKRIDACAGRLYRAMRDKPAPRPSFSAMTQFAAFRGMYRGNPALGDAYFPADMEYWREHGLLERGARYFCKARIGIVKRLFSSLFQWVIGLAAKGMPAKAKVDRRIEGQ